MNFTNQKCGVQNSSYLEGYNENIISKDIVKFEYYGTNFNLCAKKENNKLKISCNGGGKYNKRDGSLFNVIYETTDDSILKELQNIIDMNNETRENGHCVFIDGLPSGIGDRLSVEYSSGEKIYKSSNEAPTITLDSMNNFYKIFHEFVRKNGYDFTTKGSNVILFDDADNGYLQGTWKGIHFGDNIEVNFNQNHVTIKVNDKITDDNVEYVIHEGIIVSSKLRVEEGKVKSSYDYENFNGVQNFAKKNSFTLSARFYKDAYSSCDLFNYDKERLKNIKED